MERWRSKMSFRTWIMRYRTRNNPMGDLARDIADDPEFPDTSDLISVSFYLQRRHPCGECVEVFQTACKRYTTWLMKEIW